MLGFFRSFAFAFRGIRFAWAGRNFRVQCAAASLAVALGLWLNISATEWLITALIIGLVLAFEIMNSAIENIVNLVSPEFHPLAGRIKDLAAGAVLVLSILSVIIGVVVFYPYLAHRFGL